LTTRKGFWGAVFDKIIPFFRNKSVQTPTEVLDIPDTYKKLHGGTIYVRTDGDEKIVAARMYGPNHKKWESYLFRFDNYGNLINESIV
jgi:hypothetical protein